MQLEDQGESHLICLPENMQVFHYFQRAVLNEKIKIFKQNKKKLHIIIMGKSFHPWLLILLEHQRVFERLLIVLFESLSCSQCEKMNLQSFSLYWKELKSAEIRKTARHGGFF